ncbi:MAG: GGDEF domain-containing protein [Methylococcaceae bacterium]|nr:GGDEF domain-containing protein [Methylococcaceae bacterium]
MGFFSKSGATDNKIDNSDKWKDKYLNLLETQEQVAQEQKSLEELLCKTIVKLSFAIAGLDPQLDPQLQRIRSTLKNGINRQSLVDELESFAEALAHLDDQPQQPLETALLFDFLFQLYTSAEQKKALQLIRTQSEEKKFATANQLFSAIIIAIDSEQINPTSAIPVDSKASALASQIDTKIVSQQLIHLLDSIEIPAIFDSQAQIVKQLLVSHQATAYEQVLEKSINLLLGIKQHSQSEQQGIDKFLAHITEQLTELGLTVTGASTAAQESALIRSKLDQSVSEQMKALQLSSSSATKLEPLKVVINQRLETITKEIHEHNQEEAVKRKQTQEQLEELTMKVKIMESESNDLKLKLKIANTRALRDSLTGLPNRLAYQERLETELARWKRYRSPLSLIIWDIDHFKGINDNFGHKAGDKVLALIAKQLSSNCRETDFISRFGGEEFIMILPETGKEAALKLANQLRNIIEQTGFNASGTSITITISCGITEFVENDTHESAFDRADKALYQAKQLGRNQCCIN